MFNDTELQEMTKYMEEALHAATVAKKKGMVSHDSFYLGPVHMGNNYHVYKRDLALL